MYMRRVRLDYAQLLPVLYGLAVVLVAASAVTGQPAVYFAVLSATLFVPISAAVVSRQQSSVKWVIAAWSIRVLLMGVLKVHSYRSGLDGFYPGDTDAVVYHTLASGAMDDPHWWVSLAGVPRYSWVVTLCYRIFGPDINIPELLNLGLAVGLVPFLYSLAVKVGGRKSAIVACFLWAILPSGALWSVSLLKDIWVVAGVIISAHFVVGLASGVPRWSEYIGGLIGGGLLVFIRPQYILALFLAAALILFLQSRRSGARSLFNFGILLGVMGLMIGAGFVESTSDLFERALSSAGADRAAEIALTGGSGIAFLANVPSSVRWLFQFPFSVFAPFPWQWLSMGSGLTRLVGLEMAAIYGVYYMVFRRFRYIWANPRARAVLLYAFAFFLAVSFALPNIGSMYRYRWPAIVLLLAVAYGSKVSNSEPSGY